MKIKVDYDLCETNEVCTRIAPQIFQVGDDDVMHILQETFGPDLRDQMDEAVRCCPRQALRIVEE